MSMSKRTILVAEDDQLTSFLVQCVLEKAGYDVVTACDGREALEHLDGCSLVITDILMPEMDGFELIRRVVADRPSLPIVATSGATDWPAYLQMATSLGAKAVLHKPVVAAELLATVQQVLAADPVRRLDDRRATGTGP